MSFGNNDASQKVGSSLDLTPFSVHYSSRSQEAQIDTSQGLNSQVVFVCL